MGSRAYDSMDESRWRSLGAASLTLLALVVLAPLSLAVALLLAPSAFGVESGCFGAVGAEGSDGDAYIEAAAVAGAIGWMAVFVAVLFAQIAERARTALVLTLAWFAAYVAACVAAAAVVGPAPCPG